MIIKMNDYQDDILFYFKFIYFLFKHIFGLYTDQGSTRYFPINIIQQTILPLANQKIEGLNTL